MAKERIEVETYSLDHSRSWWRWKARNNEILAVSETFSSVSNARRAGKKAAKKLGIECLDLTKVK